MEKTLKNLALREMYGEEVYDYRIETAIDLRSIWENLPVQLECMGVRYKDFISWVINWKPRWRNFPYENDWKSQTIYVTRIVADDLQNYFADENWIKFSELSEREQKKANIMLNGYMLDSSEGEQYHRKGVWKEYLDFKDINGELYINKFAAKDMQEIQL